MRWQGFALGFLGLTFLEVLVSSKNATNTVGGLFSGPAKAAQWFIDPGIPAFNSTSGGGGLGPLTNPGTGNIAGTNVPNPYPNVNTTGVYIAGYGCIHLQAGIAPPTAAQLEQALGPPDFAKYPAGGHC